MLTSLNFLGPGQPWPPRSEKARLDGYKANRQIFESDHSEVYREQFRRIERVIGNFAEVVSYPVILNYQKLITVKLADLLLGEAPDLVSETKQQIVDNIRETSDLINTAYETAIDVSRYGDGVFYIYKDDSGKGYVDITQPSCWFVVVQPDNIKRVQYHVLAWSYDVGDGDRKKSFLKVQIHEKGWVTKREYQLDRGQIGPMVAEETRESTGLSDFAVVPVHNLITSDRIYGIDDYKDIDSIISDLEVRVAQIDKVLDKHTNPTMTGPSGALVEEDGQWKLKVGNYIPNDPPLGGGSVAPVEYVTWDAHMEANFKQIEKLVNFLYTLSEMGSAVFGDMTTSTGQVPSGSALKRLLISPLAKVNRVRMRFDPALKKAIRLASEIGWGIIDDLTITWKDGLPDDEKENSEIVLNYSSAGAVSTWEKVRKASPGLSEEATAIEVGLIQKEQGITIENPDDL